ncbi:MAG: hypothetical protein IMY79_03000 [Chloroflexi bacterium]|nr:hypothetical protein [Chloroflexota bacterium]
MRVIDEQFVTPVLREEDLLRVNKFGVMMTRSLAENYPYTVFYKADIRGAKGEWLQLVDLLETGEVNAESALQYMIYLLIKRSERFQSLASKVVELAKQKASSLKTPEDVLRLMTKHMANPSMPAARLLEITMHSLLQAVEEMRALGDTELRPLSQMRQANKKAGNLADVELATAGAVVEAWDAKFGKPYLYDELLELGDKLEQEMWATLEIVGFVTDQEPDLREDVRAQMEEIQNQFEIEVAILPLSDWVYRQVARVPSAERGSLAPKWLIAYAESLALHRTLKAPIDEPTEAWLEALEGMLS